MAIVVKLIGIHTHIQLHVKKSSVYVIVTGYIKYVFLKVRFLQTSLVVQWVRIHCQCRGHGFDP